MHHVRRKSENLTASTSFTVKQKNLYRSTIYKFYSYHINFFKQNLIFTQ